MVKIPFFHQINRISNSSLALFFEAIRLPAIYALMGTFILFIWFSPEFSQFAFGDENKLILETCLSSILLGPLLIGILSSSSSIREELETKTLLTLLSKPLSRNEFILGKYTGSLLVVIVSTIILTITLILMVEIKKPQGIHSSPVELTNAIFYGIHLNTLQVCIVLGFSLAISPFFKSHLNICFSLAFLFLCNFNAYAFNFIENTHFLLKTGCLILFYVIPDFSIYNLNDQIALGQDIANLPIYVLKASIVAFCFILGELIMAMILFKKKEIT